MKTIIVGWLSDKVLSRFYSNEADREWDASPATPDARWTEPECGYGPVSDGTPAPSSDTGSFYSHRDCAACDLLALEARGDGYIALPILQVQRSTASHIASAALLAEYTARFDKIRDLIRDYDDNTEALTRIEWDMLRTVLIDNVRSTVR